MWQMWQLPVQPSAWHSAQSGVQTHARTHSDVCEPNTHVTMAHGITSAPPPAPVCSLHIGTLVLQHTVRLCKSMILVKSGCCMSVCRSVCCISRANALIVVTCVFLSVLLPGAGGAVLRVLLRAGCAPLPLHVPHGAPRQRAGQAQVRHCL